MLLRRALDLRTALRLGVHLDLNAIRVDEFHAMLLLEEEMDRSDLERASNRL